MEGKNTQRNPMASGSNRVDSEVARLLSKPSVDQHEFSRLRNKLGDNELVDQIQNAYLESYNNVERRAKAFAQKIFEKYGMTSHPYSQLLVKAHKYATKYELSPAEKTAFTRILEQELVGAKRPDVPRATTNMTKVLGEISINTTGSGMKVSDADYRELQDILKMKEDTKQLHSQVILQSMSYNNCEEVALNGRFSPENGHNLACHVHPVVAALFLNKIDVLEHHFLFSNIANIVACRYNKETFKTRPDYELFYNLVTDPNDVVCDSKSPLKDLKNRAYLQQQLWRSVMALRNGQYYNCEELDLMKAVDMCRLNKYDTPDNAYGRYDGTVIKRIFAAFSFRPTLVLSVPAPQVFSTNHYFQSTNPIVSSVSTINLKLPSFTNKYLTSSLHGKGELRHRVEVKEGDVNLADALKQSQLLFENGSLTMKQTQVIDTRGIMTFFVDRRSHNLNLEQYMNPVSAIKLPTAVSGFERVNDATVLYENTFTLSDEVSTHRNETSMKLNSVVVARTSTINDNERTNKNLFVGSKTYVSCSERATMILYNPMEAKPSHMTVEAKAPVTTDIIEDNVRNEIETKGIIFVYRVNQE